MHFFLIKYSKTYNLPGYILLFLLNSEKIAILNNIQRFLHEN